MRTQAPWNPADKVREVAQNTFFVHGPASNWVILAEDSGLTLIDTGYPGDRELLENSIRHLGRRPDEVVAVLITHGHSDHIGSAEYMRTTYGATVYTIAEEAPNIRREELHQANVTSVLPFMWRWRVARWSLHAIRAGGVSADVSVGEVTEVEPGRRLDVPGSPIPLLVPGHTPGHTCFLLPERRVVVVGDAFVTAHPTSPAIGPQMLHPMFHSDLPLARASLSILSTLDIDIYLPGHGPEGVGPIGESVVSAARRGPVRGHGG